MNKLIAFLTAMTCIVSCGSLCPVSAKAMESIGFVDYQEQLDAKNTEHPFLDSGYESVEENRFKFYVYDDYAYIVDYNEYTAEEVVIPAEIEGVEVVGIEYAIFGSCTNLKKVTIPDTLKYFNGFNVQADNLEEIVISETNPYFTFYDGMLYSKDMKSLIFCPIQNATEELKISEKTEVILDYAFIGCNNLKKAIIPENIKHINNAAFIICENLESVELPESITKIAMDTFYLCKSLKEVKFNGVIEKIGMGAFNGCTALAEFEIPDTVDYIGADAFADSGCIVNKNGIYYVDNWVVGSDDNIVNAVVEDETIGIAEMSFMIREKIETLEIPESVKYVGTPLFTRTNKPSVVKYSSPYIAEKTFSGAKGTSDFYIYDKNCDIFDSEKTIPAQYRIKEDMLNVDPDTGWVEIPAITSTKTATEDDGYTYYDVTIHGYAGSTAQAYAEKYNRKFEVIEEVAQPVKGDANGDGEFTIADAVVIQQFILGNSTAEIQDIDSVDLCKDGKIDVFDLCLIRQELVK